MQRPGTMERLGERLGIRLSPQHPKSDLARIIDNLGIQLTSQEDVARMREDLGIRLNTNYDIIIPKLKTRCSDPFLTAKLTLRNVSQRKKNIQKECNFYVEPDSLENLEWTPETGWRLKVKLDERDKNVPSVVSKETGVEKVIRHTGIVESNIRPCIPVRNASFWKRKLANARKIDFPKPGQKLLPLKSILSDGNVADINVWTLKKSNFEIRRAQSVDGNVTKINATRPNMTDEKVPCPKGSIIKRNSSLLKEICAEDFTNEHMVKQWKHAAETDIERKERIKVPSCQEVSNAETSLKHETCSVKYFNVTDKNETCPRGSVTADSVTHAHVKNENETCTEASVTHVNVTRKNETYTQGSVTADIVTHVNVTNDNETCTEASVAHVNVMDENETYTQGSVTADSVIHVNVTDENETLTEGSVTAVSVNVTNKNETYAEDSVPKESFTHANITDESETWTDGSVTEESVTGFNVTDENELYSEERIIESYFTETKLRNTRGGTERNNVHRSLTDWQVSRRPASAMHLTDQSRDTYCTRSRARPKSADSRNAIMSDKRLVPVINNAFPRRRQILPLQIGGSTSRLAGSERSLHIERSLIDTYKQPILQVNQVSLHPSKTILSSSGCMTHYNAEGLRSRETTGRSSLTRKFTS